jgi:ankyrin repeat protein
MGDTEANGGAAAESSRLMDRDESAMEEAMEMHSIRSVDSYDGNSLDMDGDTPLHSAVRSLRMSDDIDDSHSYVYIDRAMRNDINLNMPNKKGYTAIGSAVEYLHKKVVKHILMHTCADRLYLDYYPGDRESTVREIIKEKHPDLQSLLPAPLMESLDSSKRDINLLAAFQHDKYNIFLQNLDSTNPNPWYDEPWHSSLLEIACQIKDRKRFVELLLESGADPNIPNRVTGMPLLHATARSGNLDVLKLLLKGEKIDKSIRDNKDQTVLHWLARVGEKEPDDKQILENCFKLFLNSSRHMNIDHKDSEGNTALYIAVKRGFHDSVITLLRGGADIMLPIHGTPILSSVSSPVLNAILDDCLESNDEEVTSENLKLTFRYEFLKKIMPHMAESPHQRESLKHPVTLGFLDLHYLLVTLYIISDMVLYIFWLLIQSYIILFPEYISLGLATAFLALYVVVFVSRVAIYLFFRNINYIFTFADSLEFLMLIYLITLLFDWMNSSWIWPHIKAIAILLAWLKLVFMSWRLPWLAVQMEMFKKVSFTFVRYMTGYSLLIITFAFTFYAIFKGSSNIDDVGVFTTLFRSILETTVMFAGEFEFSDLPFDTLPGTSHVIFLLFVLFVAIVLFNLLNGLAVGDTEKIREKAETLSLVARVRILKDAKIDHIMEKFFGSKETKEGVLIIYPNKSNSWFLRLFIRPTTFRRLSHFITTKRQPSDKPKTTEEKLMALEKKFDLRFQEMQQIFNEILTRRTFDNERNRTEIEI